ncbi:MAG: (2Fe-2S)-binding protein [Tenuifilum sp.]|uniref:(2Fe-2S)-binding protein n=1 Tax=Tenuifilum sp. TaxID=2760880 RepID=UPI0030B5E65D
MKKNEKIICHCNGVSIKSIVHAIQKGGVVDIADVQRFTLAATGCRRCFPQVEAIVNLEIERLKLVGFQLKIDFKDNA